MLLVQTLVFLAATTAVSFVMPYSFASIRYSVYVLPGMLLPAVHFVVFAYQRFLTTAVALRTVAIVLLQSVFALHSPECFYFAHPNKHIAG